jgi:hypothetical protein
LLPGRSRQFDGQVGKVHQFELHEGSVSKQWVVEG